MQLDLRLSVDDIIYKIDCITSTVLDGQTKGEHRRIVMGMSIRYLQYDLARKSLTKCVVLYRGYYN